VTNGMDVVDAISNVDADAGDKPRQDVVIERVELPA
jgi:cyclophilin family peptidyl-prolyl cis-trans isomerase